MSVSLPSSFIRKLAQASSSSSPLPASISRTATRSLRCSAFIHHQSPSTISPQETISRSINQASYRLSPSQPSKLPPSQPTNVPASPIKRTPRATKPTKQVINLTPRAIDHLSTLLDGPNPKLIRIGVKNKGCAGMAYNLDYVDQPGKFDEVVVTKNQAGQEIKVLIDSRALFSIIGSTMDWQESKLGNKFVFDNPNIKEECGCGESFLV